ncbi:hypothetical protein COT75_05020 [Candidatus Beckwithbacteria bacterium CG10_big_fil_rev_8_21_14_0_10_34_10]|uniref:Uncharacterized protein n=1 Tax=Candidatus Beckwithbacteria bacterium CG10_big_fil_rev_8_21_14_0_10_34_10 TaxID=1974495 RepID=A0A2H0W822_9BACT|nr:MAG: hypothetical protein COT75_05020 [Candidatus Beckwithbacteria bacterium CG10_big_fil_rev_8_21_14_0_10_34_10]
MKKKALVTGAAGLIGSQAVKFLTQKGFQIYGIDNDIRAYFFGKEASTKWNLERLKQEVKDYHHFNIDIRNKKKVEKIFKNNKFDLIIHTAAQPSHDWSIKQPLTDFTVNALGTMILLENFRNYCPQAVFIFTSTSKVYGDNPNKLPLVEYKTRFDLPKKHPLFKGIEETMSLDQSIHSVFGASKVAADIMVQEFGQYFNLKTGIFRGGCLTGPVHSGAQLHGFLAYLIKSIATGRKYTIFGYQGKQVRDNIHSYDLVNAFYHFYLKPKVAAVYNIGGSRYSNISILEAIKKVETILGKKANIEYRQSPRKGDHLWYISNVSKFKKDYPQWNYQYNIDQIIEDICLSGYFASATSKTSTLSFFKNNKNTKENIFLAGHVTKAYGPVQALRHYLSSRTKKLVYAEHLLAKTNNNLLNAFKDIFLNFKWFFPFHKQIKLFIGINPINALSGLILKKIGFKFKLIYYAIDYAPQRFKNPLLNILFHLIDRLNAKQADFVWSSTPQVFDLRKKQGVPDKKNVLVRSGIPLNVLAKKRGSKSKEEKAVLVIDAFLSKEKLTKLAIISFSRLRKKYPEISLKIVLGNANKKELTSLSKRLKVLDKIEFLENIPHQKIFSSYNKYGIGLGLFQVSLKDPAQFRDPEEIKAFLAAGLPVICSQGFTITEEVENKSLGLKVNNSVKNITEKVSFLLSNPDKYKKMSKKALNYSRNSSWKQVFLKALKQVKIKK